MGGPKYVSSLQYDASMTPLVSVEVNEVADSYEELARKVDLSGGAVEFKVHRIVPGKSVRASRVITGDADSADSGPSLRQRRKAGESENAVSSEVGSQGVEDVSRMMSSWRLEDKKGEEMYESMEELKDPLKWFGVLVPQALRRSQQHFITGVC